MYVCVCNALTDRDVRTQAAIGDCSVAMVYRGCGCQVQCGKCVPYVRDMLRECGTLPTVGHMDGAD